MTSAAKVADALVYLGLINDPMDLERVAQVVINPVEGVIDMTFASFEQYPIEDDDEPKAPTLKPIVEEGMTLEEATAEVERREKLR